MMIRKIALGAAAALLVVGLPVAALGISNSISSTDTAPAQVTAAVPTADTGMTVSQDQTQARQQLRLHAETGIPEGVTPTQTRQRLHTQDQANMQNGGANGQGHGQAQGRGQGHGHGQGQQGTQPGNGGGHQFGKNNGGGHQGNAANGGHNGDGTGECTNPDGPVGSGPHGTTN